MKNLSDLPKYYDNSYGSMVRFPSPAHEGGMELYYRVEDVKSLFSSSYRALTDGEIIQEGDEYLLSETWEKAEYVIGTKLISGGLPWRRTVASEQPKQQYRVLLVGEIIARTDECDDFGDGTWATVSGHIWGRPVPSGSEGIFRRKVKNE